jgi:hypothetical protein
MCDDYAKFSDARLETRLRLVALPLGWVYECGGQVVNVIIDKVRCNVLERLISSLLKQLWPGERLGAALHPTVAIRMIKNLWSLVLSRRKL